VRAERFSWHPGVAAQLRALVPGGASVAENVTEIVRAVREGGDAALREFVRRFDGHDGTLRVAAGDPPDGELRAGLEVAIANVRAVAEAGVGSDVLVELPQGHSVLVRELPVRRAAIYVPGGRAPYPSTVVMGAVTAQAAGVEEVVVCAPGAHPVILAACALCGVDEIYAMGGAHAIAALAFGSARGAERPHVIYITVDDLGWKDVGYHGSTIQTPTLDQLATSGVRLEQFYVQPFSSQTRAAVMTGRYPMRYGFQTLQIQWYSRFGLPANERLLPAALKAAGYSTALIGKWQLGHAKKEFWPTQRGFDHFYGHLTGEIDYFKKTDRGGRPVIDVGSGMTRGRRRRFPPPQVTARKAKIPLRKRPCCTVVQQQIPFTVAQISQPSAPRHGKVSLPVDDDSNWSNGEPWGA
jgi:hypothetical protein